MIRHTMLAAALVATPCAAQTRAVTTELLASTDADGTDVMRSGVNLDWSHAGDERYLGLRLERAEFKPLGDPATRFDRAYARWADTSGRWSWNAQAGSDGHTALGSANVALGGRHRIEAFVERDILETRIGVSRGLYYTFGGVAVDVPLGKRDTAVLVAGAQDFTGRNTRLHMRGTFVHTVKEKWGLTAQLRGRYFHSSVPGEFDYFSPRWFGEVLPVVQLRRRAGGWRYLLAAGYGAQGDTATGWRSSRYANAQLSTPAERPLRLKASVLYSNTPVGSGQAYDYLQGSLALTRAF